MEDRKKSLRKEKIKARNNLLPEERKIFSHKIVEQLVSSEIYQNARIIMIYRSVRGEVDLKELESIAKKQGKKIAYPRCISTNEMIALSPKENIWTRSSFGIMEPAFEHSELISPAELDLVICPCTVFDENGGRIGMGAGYYDRYIPKCTTAHLIAVAFETQKTSSIPMDAWDRPMKMIVTENAVYAHS